MSTGWAYVSCVGTGGGQAAGPTGSIQFLTGTNATKGVDKLLYHTASYLGYKASTMVLTGTLIIAGAVSASSYFVDQTDVVSGSTLFGNSVDDYHIRTGSLYVGAQPGGINPTFEVRPALSASHTLGLRVSYTNVNTAAHTAAIDSYILGVTQTGVVNVRLPTASAVGAGRLIVVKDQVQSRLGNSIYISAAAGSDTIDGSSYYELTGTMPAISLYSNGSHWFVF